MKFSVAPKSRRAMVSALFDFECIKTHSVIDFLVDRNTSWSWYCLSSADLIRHLENPGSSLHVSGSVHLSDHSGESQTQLECCSRDWRVGAGVGCQSCHLDRRGSVRCLFASSSST